MAWAQTCLPAGALIEAGRGNFVDYFRAMSQGTGTLRLVEEHGVCYVHGATAHPIVNMVLAVRGRVEAHQVQAVAAGFRWRARVPYWVLWPGEVDGELQELLSGQGFRPHSHSTCMARELTWEPLGAALPACLELRRVTDTADLQSLGRVWETVFGLTGEILTESLACWGGANLRHDAPARHYLGTVQGEAVACSTLVCGAGVAGVYGVGTNAGHRRRGIGTAMTLAALRAARVMGCRTAVLQATGQGLPIYAKLGFVPYGKRAIYRLDPQ